MKIDWNNCEDCDAFFPGFKIGKDWILRNECGQGFKGTEISACHRQFESQA